MPMYNLFEYSDNYAKTSRSLWQYCKGIPPLMIVMKLLILEGTIIPIHSILKQESQVKQEIMERKMLK